MIAHIYFEVLNNTDRRDCSGRRSLRERYRIAFPTVGHGEGTSSHPSSPAEERHPTNTRSAKAERKLGVLMDSWLLREREAPTPTRDEGGRTTMTTMMMMSTAVSLQPKTTRNCRSSHALGRTDGRGGLLAYAHGLPHDKTTQPLERLSKGPIVDRLLLGASPQQKIVVPAVLYRTSSHHRVS